MGVSGPFRNVTLKMSNVKERNERNILTHGEVHKKIIERPPKVRSQFDILGPGGKYRDEISEIYDQQKEEFLEISRMYNKLNQETMICNKTRTLEDYRKALNCKFLDKANEENKEDQYGEKLLRKRTERRIHEVRNLHEQPCTMKPWLQRHLKLNKFIWAARTVILKNRLLNVLEKLRIRTPEDIEALEKIGVTYYNVSYSEIFEQFL